MKYLLFFLLLPSCAAFNTANHQEKQLQCIERLIDDGITIEGATTTCTQIFERK